MKLLLACLLVFSSLHAAEAPPGTVIFHIDAETGKYIGSPTIAILPDGSYLAGHDLFGPKSSENKRPVGRIYRSEDEGKTWTFLTQLSGYHWSNIFVHRDQVLLLGCNHGFGDLIIRETEDFGKTWSKPVTLAKGQWHTAPVPIIEHNDRLWRSIEDAQTSPKWGQRFRARMSSMPVDANPMNPQSWTISSPIARDTTWLDGRFYAWLEGNAVVAPDGGIVNILRIDVSDLPDKAAIVRISPDGKTASFDPEKDFVNFPGGGTKFEIRKDPAGPGYWALSNAIPEKFRDFAGAPPLVRNSLALLYSPDLRNWEIRTFLIHHEDVAKYGFQYPAWQFDGEDLIAVVRTAYDDEKGGAHRSHDANFLTFHRWENFRKLTRKDDVPLPNLNLPVIFASDTLELRGKNSVLTALEKGAKIFINRPYKVLGMKGNLATYHITTLDANTRPILDLKVKRATEVRIATATAPDNPELRGWEQTGQSFTLDDPKRSLFTIYSRQLPAEAKLRLPRNSWSGSLLLVPNE